MAKKKKSIGNTEFEIGSRNGKHFCSYCKFYIESPVRKKGTKEIVYRKCKTRGRLVNNISLGCKYFNPHHNIYCDKNNQRINLLICLQRRRNPSEFKKTFKSCRSCRQFELNVEPIIQDYYFGSREIIHPETKQMGRKIKRRGRRVINRREGHEKKVKRVIKRREKRVIKRRVVNKTRVIKRRK